MIKEAYDQGVAAANVELEKLGASQEAAAVTGALLGPFAGLAAEDGKGWRTAGGAMAGKIGGTVLGGMAGGRAGSVIGSLAGGGAGAYYAHGPNKGAKKKKLLK